MSAQYSYDEHPSCSKMFLAQFCSPNVVIMAVALFIAVQRIAYDRSARRHTGRHHALSFGTYLMHYLLIGPAVLLLSRRCTCPRRCMSPARW